MKIAAAYEQKYFSTDDVEFLRSLVQREIDRAISTDEIIEKIKKELFTIEQPKNDCTIVAKESQMDPANIESVKIPIPEELDESIRSGKAFELVEVQPMKNPDTFEFPPKKKRGRPKGSKNKPKVIVSEEPTESN